MKNKIIHDALILTMITIVAGFLLGLVHDITLDPIAKANRPHTARYFRMRHPLNHMRSLTRMRRQKLLQTLVLQMTWWKGRR